MIKGFLFSVFFLYAQTDVAVYVAEKVTISSRFERAFIEYILDEYNKENQTDLRAKFVHINSFSDHFIIHNTDSNAYQCSIDGISITKSRKVFYSFSYPYQRTYPALMTIYPNEVLDRDLWKKETITIGLTKHSIYEYLKRRIMPKANVFFVPHANLIIDILKEKKADYYLGDNIKAINLDSLHVAHLFKNSFSSKYGVLFPKKSKLQRMLNPLIRNFVRSDKYIAFLKAYYGKDYNQLMYSEN